MVRLFDYSNIMNDSQKKARTAEQNAQARLVLIQLLWIFVLLIIATMVWLYKNQTKLVLYVEERLAITKTFDSRMNDIDDRIFALTHTQAPAHDSSATQSDKELITVQLGVVDKLYKQGDYQSAIQMLHLIHLQLNNPKFALSTPIKSALESAINDDLTTLNTLQKITNPYQTDQIRLQEIQGHLANAMHAFDKKQLSHDELALRDGAMLVNLALSAIAIKDRPTMTLHLKHSLTHLDAITLHEPATKTALDTARQSITTLINEPPTLTPLKSILLLQDMPKNDLS